MMSTEAEKVAAWILEGLLDDISSWDDRIDELPNNVDGPHFDLWHLSSDPAFCINCYSLKSSVEQPVVQVCQLKCLEQKASGLRLSMLRLSAEISFSHGLLIFL